MGGAVRTPMPAARPAEKRFRRAALFITVIFHQLAEPPVNANLLVFYS